MPFNTGVCDKKTTHESQTHLEQHNTNKTYRTRTPMHYMNAISTSFDTSSDDATEELQLCILTSLLDPDAFHGKSIVVSLGSPAINPLKKQYRQTRCDAAYTRNDA